MTHRPDDLTNREIEVLKSIAEGHSTKQVAALLGIHDTATLVRYAIRNGIIQA